MYIISISHKTASVDVRKIFAFNESQKKDFIITAIKHPQISECVVLSTCNRMEIYFTGGHDALPLMQQLLCQAKNIDLAKVIKHFNVYVGDNAIHHLFNVAGGIDSMVLGEDEILGQVKNAYALGLECQATSFTLNTVFKQAITCAKKAKTLTGISKTPVSIGTLATNQVFGLDLKQKTVLIIGVNGKMGTVVAKNLMAKPNIKVFGTLRTHKADDQLEARYENLTYVNYCQRYDYMQADVIISATSSPHYTVTLDQFKTVNNPAHQVLFIDLAVPPDIDNRISRLPNVTLLGIDHFETLAAQNNLQKQKETQSAKELLEEGFNDTLKELDFHQFLPKLPLIKNFFNEKGVETAIYKIRKTATKEELQLVLSALEKLIEV